MRKQIQKGIAMLLALSMIIAVAPIAAQAEEATNLMSTATVTTNTGADTSYLNNGNYDGDTWRTGAPNGDYYQFIWTEAVTVNKVVMVTSKSHYCLPTAWHVEVSANGVDGWTQVAAATGLSSHEYGDVKLHTPLNFATQENIKGLRVYVDAAPTNTSWNGYGIREIEAYYDSNIMLAATVTTNATTANLANVADGDNTTGYWREGDATTIANDYIQFNWDYAVTANKLVMTVSKARNCAPTTWKVAVSEDGTSNWTDVASVADIAWLNLGDVIETSELTFAKKTVKGIRVYIEKANLAWNGYTILDIAGYNDPNVPDPTPEGSGQQPGGSGQQPGGSGQEQETPAVPKNGNYATIATITASAKTDRLDSLKDENKDYGTWRAGAATDIEGKDYIQFNWKNAISVSEVVMTVTKARNCAPTAWRVQVSADGENDWKEVASVKDIKWMQLGDVKETSKATFASQKDIKGLRIYIDKANLVWGGYGIQEIEIFNQADAESPKTGDTMPIVPVMALAVVSLAGAVVFNDKKRFTER